VSESVWTEVDEYIDGRLVGEDSQLSQAVDKSDQAGLPHIQVSAVQGKLLYLLALTVQARQILEIGTLGGCRTIRQARALPAGGRLISLEVDEHHAEIARGNVAGAGLDDVTDIRVGRAIDTLAVVENEGAGPFDLFFIDADKQSNADYFRWAVRLGRPGSVIIVDNVVRGGAVVDASSSSEAVLGTRRLYDAIAAEPGVEATAIQTVGNKGYDGFVIARVRGDAPAR